MGAMAGGLKEESGGMTLFMLFCTALLGVITTREETKKGTEHAGLNEGQCVNPASLSFEEYPNALQSNRSLQPLASRRPATSSLRFSRPLKIHFSATAETRSDSRSEMKNSAVLRFATVQEARDFISSNPRGLSINNYYVGLFFGSGHDDGFWSCSECSVVNHETRSFCLQCGIQNKVSTAYDFMPDAGVNTGASDIGFAPSHMVLVRGLDTLTTEEELYNVVRSISEVCRIWLVKDRVSHVSCGFGFLEFPSQMVASGFITTLSSTQNGYIGLRISGKWATPCYAHPQSLLPAPEPSKWSVWGTDGAPYQYWDINFCLSEFPLPSQPIQEAPLDFNADLEAFDAFISGAPKVLDLPGTVSAEPVSFQYSAAPTIRKPLKTSPKKSETLTDHVSSDEPKLLLDVTEDKQHSSTSQPSQSLPLLDSSFADSKQKRSPETTVPVTLDEEDIMNYGRLICRLCQRQFRETKDLDKHKDLSQLHKKNLQDKELIQKLLQSKVNRYRDRAKEMRSQQAFMNPTEKAAPENIGSRLLSKMGWKEGQGLGKDGSGIREPIKGASYSKGAGIGSGVALPSDLETGKYHDRGKQIVRSISIFLKSSGEGSVS